MARDYFFFGAATSPGLAEENPGNNFFPSEPVVARLPAPNLLAVEMQTPARAGRGKTAAWLAAVAAAITGAAVAWRFAGGAA